MSEPTLTELVAMAGVLAGGEHPCAVLGHRWESIGGRRCPRATDHFEPNVSQTVYACTTPGCGAIDYGERGGPAWRECFELGPCDRRCDLAAFRADCDAVDAAAGVRTA